MHDVPGVCALDLVADADAAKAQDAAVVVDGEQPVAGVDVDLRADPRQVEVGHAELVCRVLQLAVIVRDADRADVVALHEHHLGHGPAVLEQELRMRRDVHAFRDLGHAGRRELGGARDLDHAQAAGAAVVDPFEVAEARDVDPVLLGNLHHGLPFRAGDVLAVDPEREDGGHAITSAGSIAQTPAGQTRSTMCARYSSRK